MIWMTEVKGLQSESIRGIVKDVGDKTTGWYPQVGVANFSVDRDASTERHKVSLLSTVRER